MSFSVSYVACTFFITICSVISAVILSHWTWFHCKQKSTSFFQKLQRKLIMCQYISLICFTTVPTTWCIRLYGIIGTHLYHKTTNKLFSKPVDRLLYSEENGFPWPMYFVLFCYFIGKYTSYIIIYFRLKQMLNNSIFSYHEKTYKKILFILILHGISILMVIGTSESNMNTYTMTSIIIVAFWMFTDIIYFIPVTYMYLSKLKEIKNTYEKSFLQTKMDIASKSDTDNSKTNMNHDACMKSVVTCTDTSTLAVSTSATPVGKQLDSSVATPISAVCVDINSTPVTPRGNGNNTPNRTINSASRMETINRKAAQELSYIVGIYTRLSIIIFMSSFGVFVAVYIADSVFNSLALTLVIFLADCLINTWCLVLYFQRERNFYQKWLILCK